MDPRIAMTGPEFDPATVYRPLVWLPVELRLLVLLAAVLVASAGCTVAWISGPQYPPSRNICRVDETARTDCVHVTPTVSPTAGVRR
ncbi:hypothetical protein [Nocardia arthritidis]|uniref:Uncharacterized protein n=1 Tax=Nocardia arthritidis TaxID=228602 RepID=A0A6G9YC36_9NOCA|nr:hypothetical protein [Nocardia arthritidis]QIS10637.1 hypothetical protein F5544_13745 [Nocardia arthritidis]